MESNTLRALIEVGHLPRLFSALRVLFYLDWDRLSDAKVPPRVGKTSRNSTPTDNSHGSNESKQFELDALRVLE